MQRKKKQKNNRYKFIRWKKEPATTGYYLMKPDKTRYARSNSWKTSAYSVNLIETCKSSFSVDETRCSILENRVKPGRIRRNGETRSNRVVKVVFFFKRIEKMARARAWDGNGAITGTRRWNNSDGYNNSEEGDRMWKKRKKKNKEAEEERKQKKLVGRLIEEMTVVGVNPSSISVNDNHTAAINKERERERERLEPSCSSGRFKSAQVSHGRP